MNGLYASAQRALDAEPSSRQLADDNRDAEHLALKNVDELANWLSTEAFDEHDVDPLSLPRDPGDAQMVIDNASTVRLLRTLFDARPDSLPALCWELRQRYLDLNRRP